MIRKRFRIFHYFSFLLLILSFSACHSQDQEISSPEGESLISIDATSTTAAPTEKTKAEIIFEVEIPEISQPEPVIYLDLLDEVTGLALNPLRFPMEKKDEGHHFISIPFSLGTVVKYRYVLDGNPISIEHNSHNEEVRYRLVHVKNPGVIRDIVTSWGVEPFDGPIGRIQGVVTDVLNNPLPDILVTAGGVKTITASDGSFILDGLITGTHNLVAYSINGSYQPFQQEALIALNSTTPAYLQLPSTKMVNITFIVTPPPDGVGGIPLRIVGNTYDLGNTFANLEGGMSVIASRAPLLSYLPDGRYSITLNLPSGLYLRYKYSIGDGFWNAELKSNGSFRLRDMIVPDHDITVEENISTWQVAEYPPLSFKITTPDITPSGDIISLQLNPYAWSPPIPMWPLGDNQWLYILNNPFHLLGNIQYRFCRNEQCEITGTTDAINDDGNYPQITTGAFDNIQSEIENWVWIDPDLPQTTIVGSDVISRGASFVAGVELLENYTPSWQPYYGSALQNIRDIGANWVILTPTWHFTKNNPPTLEITPGKDPLWSDLSQMNSWAAQREINVAIFPQTKINQEMLDTWWSDAILDSGWWQSWFDRYRTFILHHADFAAQHNVSALIIGEPGMLPALPNGLLPNGDPSNVFPENVVRWDQLISEIRTRYKGTLILALDYQKSLSEPPPFLKDVDQIYVLVSTSLAETVSPSQEEISSEISRILDEEILPFRETYQKPIILGIKYPATNDATLGCIPIGDECLSFDILDQPNSQILGMPVDLQVQYEIYESFLSEINHRDWIDGIVSRAYYPPAELQDPSSSIHGKPSSAVLWYWYPRLTGKIQ
ncbi:MAG: hypothetical protein MUO76_15260 [Anaerolineaceae bacterium]|nr:hypothetical protein [Anaerolineaceae bacterium]